MIEYIPEVLFIVGMSVLGAFGFFLLYLAYLFYYFELKPKFAIKNKKLKAESKSEVGK